MLRASRFAELSPARQRLLRLFQSTDYGYIEDLPVRDREPVLSAESVVLIDLKLDSERRPRLELAQVDFALCAENIRLMALFDDIQDGRISKIEVRAGVPRRVVFEERIANFGSEPSRPSQ